LLSILTSVALNLDTILAARTLGLAAAANYSIVARLFSALSLLITLVGMPLWPANGEALARGDVAWVQKNSRRMLYLSGCITAVPGLLLALLANHILRAWVRSAEVKAASASLLVALLLWSILVALSAPLFMVQNSIGLLGPQFLGWGLYLVLSVIIKTVLVPYLGVTGLPVGACIAYVAAVLPAAITGYRKSLELIEETTTANLRTDHRV
jgi:O-antigen/teichoic acid export membrane protein